MLFRRDFTILDLTKFLTFFRLGVECRRDLCPRLFPVPFCLSFLCWHVGWEGPRGGAVALVSGCLYVSSVERLCGVVRRFDGT